MIGRKGTTDTLSFLIGVIIFLLIVIPIGIAVYHYMFAQSGMQKTLDLLVERTSELEDGQNDSIIGYIDNGYILISFEKDQSQFGSTETTLGVKRWSCKGVGDETFTMYWGINKPSQCGKKACLCACGESGKDIPLVGDWLDLAGPNLCSGAKCVVYDESENPRFYGGAQCEYGVFIAPESPTLELKYQRQGQITGICEEFPCVSQEVSNARNVYNELMEKYDKCKNYNAEDCICESTHIYNMPIDHAIKFVSDGRTTTTGLYDEEGQKRTEVSFEDKPFGIYDPAKDEAKQVTALELKSSAVIRDWFFFETTVDSGPFNYEGKDNIYLYKAKGGFVSFVAGNPDKIKEDKDYCWIKSGAAQTQPGEVNKACSDNGKCKAECGEMEYAFGRKGQYCPTLTCCIADASAKCVEKGGSCYASCESGSLTPIAGENLCTGDNTACCKSGSPCENLANGECKSACDDRLNEEEASGSYFTSPACTGGEICCVQKEVPLGTG
ncbi:MAG: hypothetical protein WC852_03595 [Candidatus Nanoarchaeia archaeon]|jgi:hypothetical protein